MSLYRYPACKSHIDSGEDWQTMIRKGSNQAGESALTGDWKPMDAAPQPEPAPPAPTPAAQPQPAVSRFATLWLDSIAWILLYPNLHDAILFCSFCCGLRSGSIESILMHIDGLVT